MKESFTDFINQIPDSIYSNVKTHISSNIALFKPKAFVKDVEMISRDYQIVFPSATPPPTRIENREYYFRKNRLITFNHEVRVKVTAEAPTQEYTAVSIDRDFLQQIAREATGKENILFSIIDNPFSPRLAELIKDYEMEMSNYGDNCPMMIQCISTQIVLQLLRDAQSNAVISEKKLSGNASYVNKAIEYIHTYYNANISIDDISNDIHISPYYLIRMFKDETGQTPHEYLTALRISKAEEFLKRSNCSIAEAAKDSGFVNQAHFSALFKRVKGIRPSEYKKSYSV